MFKHSNTSTQQKALTIFYEGFFMALIEALSLCDI